MLALPRHTHTHSQAVASQLLTGGEVRPCTCAAPFASVASHAAKHDANVPQRNAEQVDDRA